VTSKRVDFFRRSQSLGPVQCIKLTCKSGNCDGENALFNLLSYNLYLHVLQRRVSKYNFLIRKG